MRMHVRRLLARTAAVTFAALVALSSTSCGGSSSGGESVFLYIIHGYAGAETMSLIGPTGPIVSGLEFGERADGNVPIEVDRTLGGDFTLILDGSPQPLQVTKELFSLYPQETATLFITRKSSVQNAQATMFRHVQSISRSCLLTFHNSLSLDNNFSTTEFNIYPEFNIPEQIDNGFFDESQEVVQTECGPINDLPNPAPIPRTFRGTPIHEAVAAYPWFLPGPCPEGLTETFLCYYWGEPAPGGEPTIIYDGGVALAHGNTRDYFNCLEGALTVKQPEDPDNPLPFPPPDAQVQCPDGPLTWDDINVDTTAVRECAQPRRVDPDSVEPGAEDTYYSIVYPGQTESSCDVRFRIRTALLDVVFGPNDGEELGRHGPGRGQLIDSTIQIPLASEHFYVLFGRPVNPLVWQWNSGETFADLAPFPYFGPGEPAIGEYDDTL